MVVDGSGYFQKLFPRQKLRRASSSVGVSQSPVEIENRLSVLLRDSAESPSNESPLEKEDALLDV